MSCLGAYQLSTKNVTGGSVYQIAFLTLFFLSSPLLLLAETADIQSQIFSGQQQPVEKEVICEPQQINLPLSISDAGFLTSITNLWGKGFLDGYEPLLLQNQRKEYLYENLGQISDSNGEVFGALFSSFVELKSAHSIHRIQIINSHKQVVAFSEQSLEESHKYTFYNSCEEEIGLLILDFNKHSRNIHVELPGGEKLNINLNEIKKQRKYYHILGSNYPVIFNLFGQNLEFEFESHRPRYQSRFYKMLNVEIDREFTAINTDIALLIIGFISKYSNDI